MIYNHCRAAEVDNNILDLEDLIAITRVSDDMRRFYDEWEMTLTGIRNMPDEEWLDMFSRARSRDTPGSKKTWHTTTASTRVTPTGATPSS